MHRNLAQGEGQRRLDGPLKSSRNMTEIWMTLDRGGAERCT